jgi:hypothetical protein
MRAGIDVFDHRIALGGIEVPGTDDQAVNVGAAVAALGDERLGRLEAGGDELADVGLLQRGDQASVAGAAQLRDRWQVDPRIGVDIKDGVRR